MRRPRPSDRKIADPITPAERGGGRENIVDWLKCFGSLWPQAADCGHNGITRQAKPPDAPGAQPERTDAD